MKYIPLILFFVLTVALSYSLVNKAEEKQKVTIIKLDRSLPAFVLASVYDGKDGLSSDDFTGKYSLLNVFASWCLSCAAEQQDLVRIKETYNVPIYGLNWKDDNAKVQKWLEKLGNPYDKIGADPEGKIVVELGVTGAPETFLINDLGKIILRFPGPITLDVFREYFLPHLDKKTKM